MKNLSRDMPQGCSSATRVCFIFDSFATRFGRYCSAHDIVNCRFDIDAISLSAMARGAAQLSVARGAASEVFRLIEAKE